MDKFRMRFSKTGRAVYISHLDLMHTFQRGFSRAGYALKYSEGFNPHPLISIAMPLSVGTSSVCELMDFRLKNDREYSEAELKIMAQTLSGALPEGIEIQKIYCTERKINDLKWLLAEGTFQYDRPVRPEDLRSFYTQEKVTVTKKTKHGTAEINLREGVKELRFDGRDDRKTVTVSAVLSAQEPVINPELLVEALRQHGSELVPDFYFFHRMDVFDAVLKQYT